MSTIDIHVDRILKAREVSARAKKLGYAVAVKRGKTLTVPGRIVEWNGKMVERWANQTDSGQNRLGPSPTRKRDRSETYQGIAKAMANQWNF